MKWAVFIAVCALAGLSLPLCADENPHEITPLSEAALERGLAWLAKNQGSDGSWGTSDLGLVSMGALAYMSAGHSPGLGRYGRELERALEFIASRSRPSGLLNIADSQRDILGPWIFDFDLSEIGRARV